MAKRVCRCCAQQMSVAAANNPNICADCAQLLEDESPILAATSLPERPTPAWNDDSIDAESFVSPGTARSNR